MQFLHAILRVALEDALRDGLIQRNVAKLVSPPRVRRSEVMPLTPVQARHLLDVARTDRLYALYVVALGLGLRRGEVLGLAWCDVDLDEKTLRVRQALQRTGGSLQLVEPKSERSRRTLPMPSIVVEALRAHRVQQAQDRLAAGSMWHDSGLVFTSVIGTALEPRNVTRRFKDLAETAGLPSSVRLHDLRHTAASFLLAQGVQPRVVMETLGHSGISLTMNTYAHVMPVAQRQAASEMDAVLGGTS
ncbi:MAG TPA: site-specific integrase [Mycobacteriales bacterium]|nr:site-specific integrase [Mycobacteriales bacterium]